MATGKQHFVHNTIAAIATTGAAYYYGFPIEPVLLANAASLFLSPDLDMEKKTTSENILAYILSKFLFFWARKKTQIKASRMFAAFIMILTSPYAFFLPHRSWLSHLPPFSVIIQIAYFYGVYYALCKIFDYTFFVPDLTLLYNNNLQIAFVILCLQHLVHLMGDGGMILFFGKKIYIFTKQFYNLSRKLFPQNRRD